MTTAVAFALAFKTQLATRFAANQTFNTVAVRLVAHKDADRADSVTLIRAPIVGSQEYAVHGRRRRNESFDLPAMLEAYSPDPDPEAAVLAAAQRAEAILKEVIAELRTNPPIVGDQTKGALIREIKHEPLIDETGGYVWQTKFLISYESRVS